MLVGHPDRGVARDRVRGIDQAYRSEGAVQVVPEVPAVGGLRIVGRLELRVADRGVGPQAEIDVAQFAGADVDQRVVEDDEVVGERIAPGQHAQADLDPQRRVVAGFHRGVVVEEQLQVLRGQRRGVVVVRVLAVGPDAEEVLRIGAVVLVEEVLEFADVVAFLEAVGILRAGRDVDRAVEGARADPDAAAVEVLDVAVQRVFARRLVAVAEGVAEIPEIGDRDAEQADIRQQVRHRVGNGMAHRTEQAQHGRQARQEQARQFHRRLR